MRRRSAGPRVRVRVYNVRFGDCVLLSIGEGSAERHALFDFGNAPSGVHNEGGRNDVFAPIAKDIRDRTGARLHLVVMSHEHLDHMEGFLDQKSVFDGIQVDEVWMSVMSAPDYYRRFPDCQPEKKARAALAGLAHAWDASGRFNDLSPSVRAMIANNVLSVSNPGRVDFVRKLTGTARGTKYQYRTSKLSRTHPLGRGVSVEVLAPEQRSSAYYPKRRGGLWLDVAARFGGAEIEGATTLGRAQRAAPRHVAPDEFERLRDDVADLDVNDLLAIDKAANNTSLVVRVTVGGKVMFFPGDAEQESWAIMKTKGLLGPVDLLKVAHHGSVNGMPYDGAESVVDDMLRPDGTTVAVVSTCRGVYGKSAETAIPHRRLMALLKSRCARVIDTEHDARPGAHVDVEIA